MKLPKFKTKSNASSFADDLSTLMNPVGENDPVFFDEPHFNHMLRVERMRSDRSKKPFLLLLIDISRLIETSKDIKVIDKVKEALKPSLREIDIRGWYHNNKTIGVLFTEIASIDEDTIDDVINKISNRFRKKLNPGWVRKIDISYLIP